MKAPSACTNVVEAAGHWSPSSEIPAAINVPGANGCVGTTEVNGADRLVPRAAGFVQAVSSLEPAGSPRKLATRLAPRPNSAASGGVSLNVLNASTHESCVARLQVGTRRNVPPRSDFSRTVTLPPRSTAETIRRRSARWLSMRRRMSRSRW